MPFVGSVMVQARVRHLLSVLTLAGLQEADAGEILRSRCRNSWPMDRAQRMRFSRVVSSDIRLLAISAGVGFVLALGALVFGLFGLVFMLVGTPFAAVLMAGPKLSGRLVRHYCAIVAAETVFLLVLLAFGEEPDERIVSDTGTVGIFLGMTAFCAVVAVGGLAGAAAFVRRRDRLAAEALQAPRTVASKLPGDGARKKRR